MSLAKEMIASIGVTINLPIGCILMVLTLNQLIGGLIALALIS